MKRMLLFVLVLFALIISACGNSSPDTNSSATLDSIPPEFAGKTNPFGADAVTAGAEVFNANCVPCHGPQGHGDGPASAALSPQPKNLAELQKTAADDYLFWRINNGKEGTSMVAWRGVLTEEQIWQVIAFIRTLQ